MRDEVLRGVEEGSVFRCYHVSRPSKPQSLAPKNLVAQYPKKEIRFFVEVLARITVVRAFLFLDTGLHGFHGLFLLILHQYGNFEFY